jgi:hypothetical protein
MFFLLFGRSIRRIQPAFCDRFAGIEVDIDVKLNLASLQSWNAMVGESAVGRLA